MKRKDDIDKEIDREERIDLAVLIIGILLMGSAIALAVIGAN